MEKFPTANPDIGSPEHFEQAKNQNKSAMPTDWSDLEKWSKEQGPAPWNRPSWQTESHQQTERQNTESQAVETIKFDNAINTFRNYETKSTPDRYSQKAEKRQPSANLLGTLAAAIPTSALVGDVVLNGPSNFVIEHPEAATVAIAAFAGFVAVTVSKSIQKAEANHSKGGN